MTANTNLNNTTIVRLIPGDRIEYFGSVGEFYGTRFTVTAQEEPTPALILACMGDQETLAPFLRYTIENGRGDVLKGVRRESVVFLR